MSTIAFVWVHRALLTNAQKANYIVVVLCYFYRTIACPLPNFNAKWCIESGKFHVFKFKDFIRMQNAYISNVAHSVAKCIRRIHIVSYLKPPVAFHSCFPIRPLSNRNGIFKDGLWNMAQFVPFQRKRGDWGWVPASDWHRHNDRNNDDDDDDGFTNSKVQPKKPLSTNSIHW